MNLQGGETIRDCTGEYRCGYDDSVDMARIEFAAAANDHDEHITTTTTSCPIRVLTVCPT